MQPLLKGPGIRLYPSASSQQPPRSKKAYKGLHILSTTGNVGTLFIEPGSPWENGYVERFNGKLRDECLNGELFLSLAEARYALDAWRLDYNHRRPHSGIPWQTPAAFAPTLPGPSVGTTPLPADRPMNRQQILL